MKPSVKVTHMSNDEQNGDGLQGEPSPDKNESDGPSPTSQIHNVPDEPPRIWPSSEQTNLGKLRGLITCPQVPDPVLRLVWRVRKQEDPETYQACWQKAGAFQEEFGWNWEKFEVTRTKAVVLGLLWEYDRPGQTTLRRVPHPLPGEEELEQWSQFLDWVSSQESDPSWYDKNDREQLRELRHSGCTPDEMQAAMSDERLDDSRGARKSESGGARKSESEPARKSESGVPGNPGHDLGDGLRGRDSGTVLHGEVVKRAGRKPPGSPDPSPRKQPEKTNGSSADGQREVTADQDECVPREPAGRWQSDPDGGWTWVRRNGHRALAAGKGRI